MHLIVRIVLLACVWALHVRAQGSFNVTSPPAGIVLSVGQSFLVSWDIDGIPVNYTSAQLGWRTGSRNAPVTAPGTADVMGINPHTGTYTTIVPQLAAGTYYYCVDAYGTQWGISQGFTIEDISYTTSSIPVSSSRNSSSSASGSSLGTFSSLPLTSALNSSASATVAIMLNSSATTGTITSPTQNPSSNTNTSNLVPIVGSVIAVVTVGIIALALIFYKRRYRYRDEPPKGTEDGSENKPDTPIVARTYSNARYDPDVFFAGRSNTSADNRPVATAHMHYVGDRSSYEPKNAAGMTLKPDEYAYNV